MRNEILEQLVQLQEPQYRDFSLSLLPDNTYPMMGVRIPKVRKLAQQILKTDPQGFLKETTGEYFEEVLLEGFVLAGLPIPFKEKQNQIMHYLPKISNWSLCDSFVTALKDSSTDYYEFSKTCIQSNNPYTQRFAIVSFLMYYIQSDHIGEILDLLSHLHSDHYYVNMAIAWCLAESLVFNYDQTLQLLFTLDHDWVVNKTIQKARESYRISPEKKEQLKSLKRS